MPRVIRTNAKVYTKKGEIKANGCKSLFIKNIGDEKITLWGNFPLEAGDPGLILGGDIDAVRDDIIPFTFAGGGADPKLIVLSDIETTC